jgi:hypothetical protein
MEAMPLQLNLYSQMYRRCVKLASEFDNVDDSDLNKESFLFDANSKRRAYFGVFCSNRKKEFIQISATRLSITVIWRPLFHAVAIKRQVTGDRRCKNAGPTFCWE